MIKKLVILAAVVTALAVPSVASAAWAWTPQAVEQTLLNQGLKWSSGHEDVLFAECKGYKKAYWFRKNGRSYFRKHTCYVETDAQAGENAYFIRFEVLGKNRWRKWFLRFAE